MDAAEFPLFVQIQLFMLNNASLRYTKKYIFKGRAFDMRSNICALQTLQTNGMLPILMSVSNHGVFNKTVQSQSTKKAFPQQVQLSFNPCSIRFSKDKVAPLSYLFADTMPLEYALQHRGYFPDPGPWKIPQTREVVLRDTLGIEALPRQRFNKTKRTPYVLNIMVVGESGLGKTTFMNTLFNTPLKEEIHPKNPQSTQTVEISPVHYELVEDGVTLNLTVVDTPGFGDQLNREHNLDPIVEYIDNQFEAYHAAERSPEFRRAIPDTRIHALLYFIAPTELDIKSLQVLSAKVNVIPVIAKADTLTQEEKAAFKKTVCTFMSIFPTAYPDDRESVEDLEKYIPFTVIGSDQFVDVGGKKVRGRSYRWGVVEVENEQHCDFIHLRELLMTHALHDLLETSHTVHYHNYRAQKLRSSGRPESILACDDSYEHRIERSKQSMAEEMIKKEEEMRQNFVMKVREKEANLREREEQLNQRRQQLMAELEEQRLALASEEREFQELYNANRSAR
ncbi:9294_t:CDS:10 [Scutellospora calospora]|uniref:9294_t:CDS:1 n=1 Tax=Scutellospora calospora TaxID=85575 RepID=A0ACA9K0Y6_9GLOM|nr:9294_t:CDS:10 [Scutellospora calospora]